MKTIQVGNLTIDGSKLFLIAGPCVIEGYDRTLMIGREIKKICERLGVQYISKPLMTRQTVPPSIPSADRVSIRDLKSSHPSRRNCRCRFSPTSMTSPSLKSIQGPGHDPNPGIPLPPDRPCLRRSQDRRTGQCEEGPVHGSGRHEECH